MGKILIRKILVAIDGSKSADKALDFALDIANKYSAEIVLVTVFEEPSSALVARGTLYSPASTEIYLKELMEFHEEALSKALKKAKKVDAKLEVSKQLLTGRAADKIVEKLAVFDGWT